MHCYNCGKEIDDKAVVCVGCGVAVKPIKPQEKKLSGLQIASYVLFGLQLFALIGLGAQYDLGTVFYVLGYFSLTIAGVICLIVDNSKKTKGVVSEAKQSKEQSEKVAPKFTEAENTLDKEQRLKMIAILSGILGSIAFIVTVVLIIQSFILVAIVGIDGLIIGLGIFSLFSIVLSILTFFELKKLKNKETT